MKVNVTIPANTTATIILPEAVLAEVKEGKTKGTNAKGVKSANQVEGGVRLEIGSGAYIFSYLLKQSGEGS